MKRTLAIALVVCLSSIASAGGGVAPSKPMPPTVEVSSPAAGFDRMQVFDSVCRVECGEGMGSGCCIGSDSEYVYIITNAHVADKTFAKCTFWRRGQSSLPASAERVHYDLQRDVAILRVPVRLFAGHPPKAYTLDFNRRPKAGEEIISAGCANGSWATAFRGHVTEAVEDQFYFLPPPADGRSGSPVLSADGKRLVGLLHARTTQEPVRGLALNAETIAASLTQSKTQCLPGMQCWKPESKSTGDIYRNFLGRQEITPRTETAPVPSYIPPSGNCDQRCNQLALEIQALQARIANLEELNDDVAANASSVSSIGEKVEAASGFFAKWKEGGITGIATAVISSIWGSYGTIGVIVVIVVIGGVLYFVYKRWVYPMLDRLDGVEGDGINVMTALEKFKEEAKLKFDKLDGDIDYTYKVIDIEKRRGSLPYAEDHPRANKPPQPPTS